MAKPVPTSNFISSSKTGSLQPIPKSEIDHILGFLNNSVGDQDKVKYQWDFIYKGAEMSIWDYKGVRWSTFGPAEHFIELFGDRWSARR